MFPKLLVRDLGVVALAALAWLLLAPLSAGAGALSDFSGVVAGALAGAGAFLLHEWGHLLGALASRSAVRPTESLRSPFVFAFDSRANSRAQFLVMSFAGFAATAAGVWAAYAMLPPELLASRVARGAVVFLAFLGVVLEVPLVVYALASGRVPPLEAAPPRDAHAPGDAVL
jgi:hypothetical protein